MRKRAKNKQLIGRKLLLENLETRWVMASVPVGDPVPLTDPPPSHIAQQDPDVALADDGRYVVTWSELNNGVSQVHAQAFDAYHRPVGEELVIASNAGRSINRAEVAIAENGHFAIAYEWQESLDAEDRNIYVRLYHWGEDTPRALERVNTIAGGAGRFNPDVAMADDGSFVVTWQHNAAVDENDVIGDVFFRTFTPAGEPREPADVQVYDSEFLDRRQARPSVDIHDDGSRIVFAWEEQKVNIGYAVYDRATDGSYQKTKTAEIDGSSRDPKDLPVIGLANDKSYTVAYMQRKDQEFPDPKDRDQIHVKRYTAASVLKEDCSAACRPNDLDNINGLQATNNAVAKVQGDDVSGPALDVDSNGDLVFAWHGEYVLDFGGQSEPWPTEGNDVYFKEFTDRQNGAAINFTDGLKSDSPNFRWGRVHPQVAGQQRTAKVSKNHSGFIVAYVDGVPNSRIMLRRYSDPIDFAGRSLDAARSTTDANEQLVAGQDFAVSFSVENLLSVRTTMEAEVFTDSAKPPPVEVKFYLSSDEDISDADLLLGTRRVTAEDLQKTLAENLTLPAAGHSIWNGNGSYFIGMITDATNEFLEGNEANNRNLADAKDRDGIQVSGTVPLPPQFAFSVIADVATQAPGTNLPFTGFMPPAVSEGIVSFIGETSAGEGLYRFAPAGLSTLADTSTPAPGGDGNIRGFTFFGNDVLTSDKQQTAFYASDQSLNPGIYSTNGSAIALVANESTDIPGGGGKFANITQPSVARNLIVFVGHDENSKVGLFQRSPTGLSTLISLGTSMPGSNGQFDEITNPAIEGDTVAFRGQSYSGNQEGIFVHDATGVRLIANRSTNVPGSTGTFGSFAAPGHLAIEGGDVAFIATNSNFASGVYLYSNGSLSKIADTNDSIPNGTGKFTSFTSVTIHDGVVAFHGGGEGGQQGIYVNDGGTLLPVVAASDVVAGRTIDFMHLHSEGMDANWLAFSVNFTNGEQAVIQGRRLRPSVSLTSFSSTGNDKITVSYSIVDGPLPSFDVKFYSSPTAAFNTSATLLDSVSITDPQRLTTGTHTVTFTLGAAADQVSLPGAGSTASNKNSYIIASADTSSVPFHGLYHVAGGPVVLHGSSAKDQVKVKRGSVQVEWNGEVFTFETQDVTQVQVWTHDGEDVIDASGAEADVSAYAGSGNDVLIGGESAVNFDGGDDDDRYHVTSGQSLNLVDPSGTDHLDFSQAEAGITLDLDLADQIQTLSPSISVELSGQFENLTGTPFSDSIRVDALEAAARTISLGTATGGAGKNVVHFDAQDSAATRVGEQVLAAGHQPVTFGDVQSFIYAALPTWHRPMQREDVTNDGAVVPLDVLAIINELNVPKVSDPVNKALPSTRPDGAHFFDVNNDGFITSLDALVIINYLNNLASAGNGEGEHVTPDGSMMAIDHSPDVDLSADMADDKSSPALNHPLAADEYFWLAEDEETSLDTSFQTHGDSWSELLDYLSGGDRGL